MPRRSVSRSVSPPRRTKASAPQVEASLRSPPPPQPAEDAPPEKEPKLFVGSLADEVSQDEIRNLFSFHGEIVDLYFCRKETGSFAFVTFRTLDEAQSAIQCSGTDIHGKQIRVNFAKPKIGGDRPKKFNRVERPQENSLERDPKLYVGGLSQEVNEEDLRALFAVHGQIVDLFICRKQAGTFAFVTFGSLQEAEQAQRSSTELNGSQIRVNFAKPRKNHQGSRNQQNNQQDRPANSRACYKCQQQGHIARNCPQSVENGHNSTHQQEQRHQTQWQGQARIVYNQSTNEVMVDEDKPTRSEVLERRYDRPRSCFKCHQQGHTARSCPGNNERPRFNGRSQFCQYDGRFHHQDENRRPNIERYDPFTGSRFNFPSGREDYINNAPTHTWTNQNISNSAAEAKRGFQNRDRQFNQERVFNRNRERSKSPGTPKKPLRRRSLSRSPSPKASRKDNQADALLKENMKLGFQSSRAGQKSRSRSRSLQKPPVRAPPLAVRPIPQGVKANPAPARNRSDSVQSY